MATDANEHRDLLGARAGDTARGRALMESHGPSMVRAAWRVLGRYGGTEAEDVVQEAFVAALTTDALPTGDVGAWLRSITVRKGLDWLRRHRRRAEESLSEAEESPAAVRHPAEAIALRAALATLPAKDRAVLLLADVEGHSMERVAEILDSTRVAVKLRASRARRKLARLLGKHVGEPRLTRSPGEAGGRGR